MLTALAKYRLFKYLTFEEKEASTTSYLDEIGRGRSSLPGDQTGSIAVFNADEQDRRKKYCERIERAVKLFRRWNGF